MSNNKLANKMDETQLLTEITELKAKVEFWKDVAEKNGAAGMKYVDQQLEIKRLREALEKIYSRLVAEIRATGVSDDVFEASDIARAALEKQE